MADVDALVDHADTDVWIAWKAARPRRDCVSTDAHRRPIRGTEQAPLQTPKFAVPTGVAAEQWVIEFWRQGRLARSVQKRVALDRRHGRVRCKFRLGRTRTSRHPKVDELGGRSTSRQRGSARQPDARLRSDTR